MRQRVKAGEEGERIQRQVIERHAFGGVERTEQMVLHRAGQEPCAAKEQERPDEAAPAAKTVRRIW